MARRRSTLFSFPNLFCPSIVGAALLAFVIGAAPAQAAVRTAHLWADQPTAASYVPSAMYRSTSAGEALITRVSAGRYTVDLGAFLPGFTPAGTAGALGTVHVTAYGATNNFCQVVSWFRDVAVACFDAAGRPADTRFSLFAAIGTAGDDVGYAWAGRLREPIYTADRAYAMGTSGAAVSVRRSAVGVYLVTLGSVANVGANVQVTAYGTDPRRCQVVRWDSGRVAVSCRDVAGRAADSAFVVLAMKPAADSRDFSYAWSSNRPAPSSTADPRYVFAPDASGGVLVTRTSAGVYTVRFGTWLQNVQVSAYGDDGAYCHPGSWSGNTAIVLCHNASGAIADARFSVFAVNVPSLHLVDVSGRVGVFGAAPLPGPAPDAPPLFGFVDLHTHPASFLGFGGRADGHQGMLWGRPAVGDGFRGTSVATRSGQCFTNDHSEMSSEFTDPDNFTKQKLREMIISAADGRTDFPHTANGPPGFEEWPNSLIVTHQQMDIEWLRRAHQGGLRMLVAAAVDNELIDTAYEWNFTTLMPLVRDFFAGRSLRTALGMPLPGFALATSREQLHFLQQMVAENCDFMELAFSGADARRIVAAGKMAVVLGLELDSLTPSDITTLVNEEGVRFVTPIHFVDNAVGGSASYELMFSLLSGVLGAGGQPQVMVDSAASDFRITQPFGPMQSDIDALTNSTLGWSPIGSRCPEGSRVAGRLGCSGQINSMGLTPAGRTLVRDLISRGVMVDLAHMSQRSQSETLSIAESLRKPVFNSHTGMRSDGFAEGASERAIPAALARRLLNLGGVIGVGTGTGELGDPRRIYYNAGNPLIDFRNGRREWRLDLRQPEVQQDLPTGSFTRYRVTLRIGSDNVEGSNTVTATLLSRVGTLGDCVVVPSGAGGHTVVIAECRLPAAHAITDIDGLKIAHTGIHNPSADNVNIDEVILEVDTGPAARGWLTVLQRTGGHESEVVRLKAAGPESDPAAFASHYWVTRLLPRASDLGGTITGLRVRTFTNQDDLGGSAPARLRVALSGHRESEAQTLVFARGGAPAGTFTSETMTFLSGGETLLEHADRAPSLSFGGVTLTVGADDSNALVSMIADLRAAADAGDFGRPQVQAAIGLVGAGAIAGVTTAASWAIADPLTATMVALATAALIEAHDNWSSLVAIDAVILDSDRRERHVPFLVGYNPMQRIKGAQASSTLFRGLPERIESSRLYAGVVASFTLTTQATVESVDGSELTMDIGFSDGTVLRRSLPPGYRMGIGAEQRLFIPFDTLRLGSELTKIVLRGSANVLVSSLDVGLMKDPAVSFAEAFAAFDGLGAHPTQIGFGSDLSGFEALVPFSVLNPGMDRILIPPTCTGTVDCRDLPILRPPERVVTTLPPYNLDVERVAGRTDPARSIPARRVPASLGMARVDGPASRLLDFRMSGLSTVGQLPELAATAAQADQLMRGSAATLGRQLFNSVDGMVRAWEALDAGVTRPITRPALITPCP